MYSKATYYICPKCELKQSLKEGELCSICKRQLNITLYPTINVFNNGEYRRTVCYSCHTKLDSRYDKICPECKWIICPTCGAHACMSKKIKY